MIIDGVWKQRKVTISRAHYYIVILDKSKQYNKNFMSEIDLKEAGQVNDKERENSNVSLSLQEQCLIRVNESENHTEVLKSLSLKSSYSKAIIANLKTSLMLFIVTIIMILVYSPSLLISFQIIEYNVFLWNLVYINNASNPIVYSFFNPRFRNALKSYISKSRQQ